MACDQDCHPLFWGPSLPSGLTPPRHPPDHWADPVKQGWALGATSGFPEMLSTDSQRAGSSHQACTSDAPEAGKETHKQVLTQACPSHLLLTHILGAGRGSQTTLSTPSKCLWARSLNTLERRHPGRVLAPRVYILRSSGPEQETQPSLNCSHVCPGPKKTPLVHNCTSSEAPEGGSPPKRRSSALGNLPWLPQSS